MPKTKRLLFTIRSILALPLPAAGRVFYYDTEVSDCALPISDSGERVFYVYRKVAGKPVKVALGPFDPAIPASREIPRCVDPLLYIGNRPSLNPRMARTLAITVAHELGKGNNPADAARTARRRREGELMLGAAFDRYEADHLLPEGKRSAP